ncbi:MAG: oligosaccharide flippase family protein [Fimbriimonadales bacterium]|nr:oligosaccharide flippase family protein [Fimbriimonadales bacterium]
MVIGAIIPALYAIIDSVSEREASDSIRQQAVRGGVYLTVRRGVSVILGLVGVLLLTRIVGPAAYGVFSAAQGIFNYLLFVGLMSVHIYLIRAAGEGERTLFDQAFWWLLLFSGGLAVLAAGAIFAVGTLWVRTENFVSVALLLCANLPLTVVSYVPMAMLERKMAYGMVASIEVVSQLAYYAVAIPLAWAGYGVWSLVAGFWIGQLVLPLGFFGATRYRPRWQWDLQTLRPMLRYGFTQALSEWLYNLRELAPSVILLPLAGKEATGYLAIAIRFLTMLGFVREAAGRLALSVFARVQHDSARLARAVSEAMQLQTLALGASLSGFALAAPWVLPILLGAAWDVRAILTAFGWAGARVLLSALFAIQGSALIVKGYLWLMLRANLAYAVLFLGLCYGVLPWLPLEYRLVGFLIADFVAHLPTYWYKHWGMTRFVQRPDYGITVLWSVAMLCALFAPLLGYWLYGASALLLLNPLSVRRLRELAGSLRALRPNRAPRAR